MIDEVNLTDDERMNFIIRQEDLINSIEKNKKLDNLRPEEGLFYSLTQNNYCIGNGLHSFIQNMFAIIKFDSNRKGQFISAIELNWYSEYLSKAIVDGFQYFIGNRQEQPSLPCRYSAVKAAHITHMLRDMLPDISNGFINIPHEYLLKNHIKIFDTQSLRPWVIARVKIARKYFQEGKDFIRTLSVTRCQIAAHLYCARFEKILDLIERDDFYLRNSY
jgi:hypothetical protein